LIPMYLGLVNTWYWALLVGVLISEGFLRIGAFQHHLNHKALHKDQEKNLRQGRVMYLLGVSAFVWRIMHDLHHKAANWRGKDRDIDGSSPLLEFSETAPSVKPVQKHAWYVFGLYSISMHFWVFFADFKRLIEYYSYDKGPDLMDKTKSLSWYLYRLLLFKISYLFIILVVPVLLGAPWYVPIITWFSCWFLAGIQLLPVFQIAHVNERTKHFSGSVKDQRVLYDRIIYHLLTSADIRWTRYGWLNDLLDHRYGWLGNQNPHHNFWWLNPELLRPLGDLMEEHVADWRQEHPEDEVPDYIVFGLWGGIKSHFRYVTKLPEIIPGEYLEMG